MTDQTILLCRQKVEQGIHRLSNQGVLPRNLEGILNSIRKELKTVYDLFIEQRDLLGNHRYEFPTKIHKMRGQTTTTLAILPGFYSIEDNKSIVFNEMRMDIEDGIANIVKLWDGVNAIWNTIK